MVNIEKMLRFDEGERLKAYYCSAGALTIGIGHNLEADPAMHILKRRIKHGDIITPAESVALFEYDLNRVREQLNDKIDFFGDVDENFQAILINMCFQLGIYGLLNFKNMLSAMKANNADRVVISMKNSKWYKQTPNRAKRLARLAYDDIPSEYM